MNAPDDFIEQYISRLHGDESAPLPEHAAHEEAIDVREAVRLGATDSILFARTFFPRTYRQASPRFHREIWNVLDDPSKRYCNIQVFRDGGKTSILRTYMAKRIAYYISHTILYIALSEAKALHSVKWIRRQIEFNPTFAQTFALRKGKKWQDVECEIIHGVEEQPIWLVGMGITGPLRGLNIDDFRPDLIILDDILNEENTATPEQREKMKDLIYGALMPSLSPASETPDAKMAMIQTPQNREDASVKALDDKQWFSVKHSCFTPETAELPIEYQESAWPERWDSETLRAEKRAYMERNQLSTWLREKECKVISKETSAFMAHWLPRWNLVPTEMTHVLAIDPVPPPKPTQVALGMSHEAGLKKDYEAFAVLGFYASKCYLREVIVNRGHDPLWTMQQFFYLCARYNVLYAVVEDTAYQSTLSWLLGEAMKLRRQYYAIQPFPSAQKSKYDRIIQGLTGICSRGELLIPTDDSPEGIKNSPGMQMFVQQFIEYPSVSHDDALEVVAVASLAAQGKLNFAVEGTTPTASKSEKAMIADLRKASAAIGNVCP